MPHSDHMLDAWLCSIGCLPRNFKWAKFIKRESRLCSYVSAYEYAFGNWTGIRVGRNMTQVYLAAAMTFDMLRVIALRRGEGGILGV
jgi:hypothetical protein